ncbi:PREDICTED: putative zinc finger protein At1g68190 isoform X2 [Tarenaya hassleriana]|uniref:putative zinc finger protein At1g68190 isoform X2 n=1 Tax=Tarenaya hassleriana TaxID=28532 RepID=UPI00053CA6EA|nr:PREDICTED: putative zinc finger protein At1g68190 isoform X2 [Tarenaya hassleriana]
MIFSGNKHISMLLTRSSALGKKNEMERVCEFCSVWKPVVYCKADAASLCLSCDAKVHSANALSGRHLRTLVCDSCRFRPSAVRCLDHCMFFCHGCDRNLHGVSSHHQRRVVNCYTGCPSAKDFAFMWGIRVNYDNAKLDRRYDSGISRGCSEMLVSFEPGSSSRKKKGKLQRDTGFILEQILELEKLQLSEEAASISNVSDILPRSKERVSDIPELEKDLMVDFSQSPFPQMEPLSSSSAGENSFWQCKVPSKSYQWNQNLQDIGVCEETENSDDFDIPDIDLTFRNFEELFGNDQDLITGLANGNMISSSVSSGEMGSSLFISENCSAKASKMKRGPSPDNRNRESTEKTEDSLLAVKPASRFSGGRDCHYSQSDEVSCCSPLSENTHLGFRQNAISRLKEKKKARTEEKQSHYVPRKARSEARKRRFVLTESCSSDTVGATARSY